MIRAVRPSWRQRTHTLLLQFNIQRIPKRSTRRRDAGVERLVHRRGDSRQCLIFASARPSRTLLAHYSYNLGKCAGCSPGMTWHWDNVHIAPSTPFTIARGDRRVIRAVTPTVVTFAPPAPRGVRFTTMGRSAEVSFDEGIRWRSAPMASVSRTSDPIAPEIMAVPVGISRVIVRARKPLTWWPNSDTGSRRTSRSSHHPRPRHARTPKRGGRSRAQSFSERPKSIACSRTDSMMRAISDS